MNDLDGHLSLAKGLSKLLDSQFSILGFHFGLDPVFDLIPGVGTIIPTVLSLYTIWIAYQYKLPKSLISRMIFYVVVDGVLGSIPILGTVADAFFKANEKNMRIIEQYVSGEGVVISS